MKLIVAMALRNVWRNPRRSALTGLTVAVGTAVLAIAIAWLSGVFGDSLAKAAEPAGHVRVARAAYVEREALLPLGEAMESAAEVVEAAENVGLSAFPRVLSGVTATVDDELGDVLAVAVGAPPDWYATRLKLGDALVGGRLLTGDDEMVVGAGLAERLGAEVGDELVLLGRTVDGAMSPVRGTIVGVAHVGYGLVDQGVFLTLHKARWMADLPDGATDVLVYGASRDDAVRDRGRLTLPDGIVAEAWSERQPWAALIGLVGFIQGLLQGVIVFVTALGVGNTTMMAVVERKGELGVLRAMGMTELEVVLVVVVEALGIGLLASGVGVGLGSMGALYLEQHGLSVDAGLAANLPIPVDTTLYADFDVEVAIAAFLLGVGMSALGALVPAVRATRIQPTEALRDGI